MLELHRKILGDKARNTAFYDALKAVIVPGESIVCDIGSGTGFLGFLASKLGAKECYLFEQEDEMSLSKELATVNGIENCHFIQQHSTAYSGSIQADIIVSETLGNYAPEENILESLEDAKRFLKPGGTIIPSRIEQYVCPVTSPRLFTELNVWDSIGFDLDYSLAKNVAMNNLYVKAIEPSDLLQFAHAVQRWDCIDFARTNDSIRQSTIRWDCGDTVTIYGYALWWNASLASNISISTSPFDPPTHWEQIFLPLTNPITVNGGEKLEVTIESDTSEDVKVSVAWSTVVWTKDGKPKVHVRMDSQRGLL